MTIESIKIEVSLLGSSFESCLKEGRGKDSTCYLVAQKLYPNTKCIKSSANTIYRKIERHQKSKVENNQVIESEKDNSDFKYTFEKSFTMKRSSILVIENENIQFNKDYINKEFITNKMLCTIKNESRRINQAHLPYKPRVVIYFKCMHEICKKYKVEIFDISSENIELIVNSAGDFNDKVHKTFSVARPANRGVRKDLAKALKSSSPTAFRMKEIADSSKEPNFKKRIEFGNVDSIHTTNVLKKIKHEDVKLMDFDDDDYIDLIKLRNHGQNSKWVHFVCMPFRCLILNEEQIWFLIENTPKSLVLDATGSICRNSKLLSLFFFYYIKILNQIQQFFTTL